VEKADLDKFRKLLLEQKEQLITKAKKTLNEEMALDVDDLPDEMDLASSEYNQALVFRFRGREKTLIKKIDKAIERIDNGEFGLCENCGEEITLKRLEARPVTTLCIRCKEEQEKRERAFV